jgi:hypothetical protein
MNTVLLILIAALGSSLTYLGHSRGKLTPVASSASLTLVFALITLGLLDSSQAAQLNLVFFGGTFAGMSNGKILKNWLEAALAGVFFSCIFLLTTQVFQGFGGGLGFKASLSVIATLGLFSLRDVFGKLLNHRYLKSKSL